MARISTYTQDTDVAKTDKILGTDAGGSTKNYSLDSVNTFFKRIGSPGVFVWQYKGTNTPNTGQLKGVFSSSDTFANLTSIQVSKYVYGDTTQAKNNVLTSLENNDVILLDINNQNNFGIYFADAIAAVAGTDNYNITLSNIKNSNGSLVLDEYYALMHFGGSGRTYTHEQNSAATTWTINHNLGKFPSVSIKFSSSDEVYTNVGAFAGVTYTNENTITITLAAAESGTVYLN